jgi:hypothetical protein
MQYVVIARMKQLLANADRGDSDGCGSSSNNEAAKSNAQG